MFYGSDFNRHISLWDVSKVENMAFMFAESPFTGDISKWDVSSVISMNGMFLKSIFNGDINNWTPYALKQSIVLSDSPGFNSPHWRGLGTNTEIREAIALKQKSELNQELDIIYNKSKNKVKL